MTNTTELTDYEARRAALDITSNVIARAPAGSGKTTLLTQRALACLCVVAEPEQVLAITFTNKAANEMRTRVIEALRAAAERVGEAGDDHQTLVLAKQVLAQDARKGWNLLANPNRLQIMTIDKFNGRLAAQAPLLSGFAGGAVVQENAASLYREACHALLAEIDAPDVDADDRAAVAAVYAFGGNRHDRIVPFLCDMLAKREQWLSLVNSDVSMQAMEHVLEGLCESRLEAAAALLGEFAQRAVQAAGSAGTEPTLWARGLLAPPPATVAGLAAWRALSATLVTKEGSVRARVTVREGFPAKEPATGLMNAVLKELADLSSLPALERALEAVVQLPDPTYPQAMQQLRGHLGRALKRLYCHLQVVFASRNRVDFTEVSQRALRALYDDQGVHEAALRVESKLHHILVDEFQDTSVAQIELLKVLTLNWIPGDGQSLFLVGDPMQSIYGFRQAEVRLFNAIWEEAQFNQLPFKRVQLESNFRSSALLVDFFNRSFSALLPAKSDPYTGAVAYSRAAAVLPKMAGDEVRLAAVAGDDALEARTVVDRILASRRTRPDASIAVLARNRSALRPILRAMQEAAVGHECQDVDPLVRCDAVRDLVHLILASWHLLDRLSWVGLVRSPLVGMSYADLSALLEPAPHQAVLERMQDPAALAQLSAEGQMRVRRFLTQWAAANEDRLTRADLARRVEVLWHGLGGPACVTAPELKDVREVLTLLSEHCAGGTLAELDAFLEELSSRYASSLTAGVSVMTVHKAKGLEFDEVHVVGMGRRPRADDRPLLHYRNTPRGVMIAANPGKTRDEASERLFAFVHRLEGETRRQEETRLLYVAATRARKRLFLYGQVSFSGTEINCSEGSFVKTMLSAIPAGLVDVVHPAGPVVADAVDLINPPLSPRLPANWEFPPLQGVFIPRSDRGRLPSELVLKGEGADDAGDSGFDRHVGTVFHAVMERLSIDGLAAWRALANRRAGIEQALAREGVRHANVPRAADAVMALIEAVLRSQVAVKFLEGQGHSELALSGFIDGKWKTGQIDRLWDDGEALWIIDYKTAGKGLPAAHADRVVAEEAARYAPQLAEYRTLVRIAFPGRTVRTALYFPAFDRLEPVDPGMAIDQAA